MATIGYGYGSEWHLLRWMGRHRSAFDQAVCHVVGDNQPIRWLDQKFADREWPDKELLGLEFVKNEAVQKSWADWWPQGSGIHNWDAVGQQGSRIVLVEAKANLREIKSSTGAGETSRRRIAESLREAAIGNANFCDAWLDSDYQLANRLGILHFLIEQGYDAHLVMVYFVGDRGDRNRVTPQNPDGWKEALEEQVGRLQLLANSALMQRKHDLFLDVISQSAWDAPDSNAPISFSDTYSSIAEQ